MSAQWLEQYNRTKRHYDRFAALNSGRPHDMSSDNYEDDVYNFFINCYHLKDWIENDQMVAEPVRHAVESYIASNRQLTLCEDICNARKHLYRDPKRRKSSRLPYEHPDFGRKQFAVGITTGADTTISLRDWEVNTDGGPIDAFQLATECVASWDTFLTTNGLK